MLLPHRENGDTEKAEMYVAARNDTGKPIVKGATLYWWNQTTPQLDPITGVAAKGPDKLTLKDQWDIKAFEFLKLEAFADIKAGDPGLFKIKTAACR